VLNDVPSAVRISQQTRERVLQAVADLGYQPNRAAQSLRSQRTGMLAYVHTGAEDHFSTQLMHATEVAAMQRGHVFASFSVGEAESLRRTIDFLNGNGADGVITPDYRGRVFDRLISSVRPGLPLVSQGETVEPYRPSVRFNVGQGGYLATRHLIDRGHRRIAYIASDLEPWPDPVTYLDRRHGYLRALEEAGIPADPAWVVAQPATPEGGAEGVRRILRLTSNRPTAVFLHNDWMALGALQALAGDGVAVPDELAIVGFDGLDIGQISYPALTSIRLPYDEFAALAVDAVTKLVEDPNADVAPRVLDPSLLLRNST
jgi:LacI family transcriptional regulator